MATSVDAMAFRPGLAFAEVAIAAFYPLAESRRLLTFAEPPARSAARCVTWSGGDAAEAADRYSERRRRCSVLHGSMALFMFVSGYTLLFLLLAIKDVERCSYCRLHIQDWYSVFWWPALCRRS
jgi:hypothetical protein